MLFELFIIIHVWLQSLCHSLNIAGNGYNFFFGINTRIFYMPGSVLWRQNCIWMKWRDRDCKQSVLSENNIVQIFNEILQERWKCIKKSRLILNESSNCESSNCLIFTTVIFYSVAITQMRYLFILYTLHPPLKCPCWYDRKYNEIWMDINWIP